MAAGVAAMELLTRDEITRLTTLGERLREGFRNAFKVSGVAGQATGKGSLADIHFTGESITNYREAARANAELRRLVHLSLLNRGIFAGPRCMFCISTVMGEAEVDQVVQSLRDVLLEIRNVFS